MTQTTTTEAREQRCLEQQPSFEVLLGAKSAKEKMESVVDKKSACHRSQKGKRHKNKSTAAEEEEEERNASERCVVCVVECFVCLFGCLFVWLVGCYTTWSVALLMWWWSCVLAFREEGGGEEAGPKRCCAEDEGVHLRWLLGLGASCCCC